MNYTNRPLDGETAIEYIANMLCLHRGFFIMTDMGRIGIEGVLEKDPLNPIAVVPWNNKADHIWAKMQHNDIADYYVTVGINQNASLDYLNILAAYIIAYIKYYDRLHAKPYDKLLDAAVFAHIMSIENIPTAFINKIIDEYINIHYTLKPTNHYMSEINYIIRMRLLGAKDILQHVFGTVHICLTYDELIEDILDWLTR